MLLPHCERRGEIHFHLLKSLAYNQRIALAFSLMTTGFILEAVLIESNFWLGLIAVAAGVLLLLTKGFDNAAAPKAGTLEWRPARREEVERILELNKKQKKWDQDAIDITCTPGLLVLILVGIVVAGAVLIMGARGWLPSARLALLLPANAAVMLLPFWLTGVRSILKNDKLVIKATMLLGIEEALEREGKGSGEEFQYQLQTADVKDDAGQAPRDVKALVSFHDGPPEFLGVQMQISINSVQGRDYPYFYCVLVARPEFGGRLTLDTIRRPGKVNVVVESTQEDDVDIAVIRQRTTKKSGFHTKQPVAQDIFIFALQQARAVIARKG